RRENDPSRDSEVAPRWRHPHYGATARLWSSPAPTADAPLTPTTWTGAATSSKLPVPRWPHSLLPAVQTVPSDRSATVCSAPPAIAVTEVRLDRTGRATPPFDGVPFASSP